MNMTVTPGITPLAFTSLSAKADAAKAAFGYGAVPLQQIEAIDRTVVELLLKTAGKSNGGATTAAASRPDAPVLRNADMARLVRAAQQQASATGSAQARMTPEAALTLLAMQLGALITEENGRSLSSQLELIKQRLAQRAASAAELSEAIRLAQAVVEAAMEELANVEGELAAATEALKQAEAEVARLEEALADAPPEEQEAIRAQLEAAKGKMAEQQGKVDAATEAVTKAGEALAQALTDLEDFKSEADKLDPNGSVSARGDEKARTNAAMLGELLALLQEIIGKANDAKLAAETELIQEVLRLREAENLRRSVEYQDEIAKAEAAQKKMGCIGKIIGWVVTVVAVVAAPFTGGASMALAGVGLALAIGEELGLDVMGKIMEPIMKLVMELVQQVGNVLGNVLTALGVSRAFADKIKDVLGVIAVAAMVIAAVVVTKKLAGTAAVQQLAKAVTRAVSEAISKALPQMVKAAARSISSTVDDVAKAITNSVAKVTGSSTDALVLRSSQAMKASHVMQFANQTSQGIGSVVIADMYVDAAKLRAELELNLVDTEIFRELLQKILQHFMQTNNLVADLFRQMADIQASQDETAHFVTAHIGRTAAAA